LRQVTSAPAGRVLGIFGLNGETKESDLRDEFMRYGELDDCILIMDRRSGLSKRYGFVYFKREEDATKAKEALNGTKILGNQVRIDFSYTKKPHSPTPGRYMGKTSRSRYSSGRYSHPYYRNRRSPPRGGYDYYDRRSRGDYYDRYDDRYDDRYEDRYDDRYGDRYDDRYEDRYDDRYDDYERRRRR